VQFLIILAIGMVMASDRMESPFIFASRLPGAVAIITSVLALVLIWIRTIRQKIFRELETGRLPIDLIQKTYVRAQHGLRVLALLGQALLIFGTDWPALVRSVVGTHVAGLDEFVMLIPFLLWIMAGYLFLYPADRAIRESMIGHMLYLSEPVHPIWTRGQYLAFQLQFQLLLMGLPLLFIIAAKDLIDIPRAAIVAWSRSVLAPWHLQVFGDLVPEMILAIVAGLVFLMAPFLVKWVWRAKSLPQGELRDSLVRLGKTANLKYRDILLWPTYGVIVNAAVVGFLGPMRYIMLSDGLIESLTDSQIDAVFGHEIGHVRLHHLPFFLVFAFASMGLIGLTGWELQLQFHLSQQTTEMIILSAVIAMWFGAFGYISRRFEAQSDLFGAQLLSSELDRGGCAYPNCLRHAIKTGPLMSVDPICMAGAELFSTALDRTAALNAVPRTARSWRHGSIQQRCAFVSKAAEHAPTLVGFEMQGWWIYLELLVAAAVTVAWGIYEVLRLPELTR